MQIDMGPRLEWWQVAMIHCGQFERHNALGLPADAAKAHVEQSARRVL